MGKQGSEIRVVYATGGEICAAVASNLGFVLGFVGVVLLSGCSRSESVSTREMTAAEYFGDVYVGPRSLMTYSTLGNDASSPVAISNLLVTPAMTSAVMTFNTAAPTGVNTVQYSADASLSLMTMVRDGTTSHRIELTGLAANTTYSFKLSVRGGPDQNDATSVLNFVTPGGASPVPEPSASPLPAPFPTASASPIPPVATSPERQQALLLFDRLAGFPIDLTDSRLATMVSAIKAGDYMAAAAVPVSDPGFFNITLKHFAAPMSNKGQDPAVPLNDFIATLIGVARDDIDARQLLTGNFIYKADAKKVSATVSDSLTNAQYDLHDDLAVLVTNSHYSYLDNNRYDLTSILVQTPQRGYAQEPLLRMGRVPQTPVPSILLPDTAGVMTTRQWAQEHFNAGTNRRATQYAIWTFLCSPNTVTKDFSADDSRIRMDVDRAPGGNPTTFQTSCRGCHAAGDAMSGAWAYFDAGVQGNYVIYTQNMVQGKYFSNANVYMAGYSTKDDSWINLYTQNQNAKFGWPKNMPLQGRGVNALGTMIANSDGFASCMATRAFTEVCKRAPESTDTADMAAVSSISSTFVSSGYKLKKLFQAAATSSVCLGN